MSAGFGVTAQEAAQPAASTSVNVVPVYRANPDYPAEALRQGKEGWVELSFVVGETGEVIEPMMPGGRIGRGVGSGHGGGLRPRRSAHVHFEPRAAASFPRS